MSDAINPADLLRLMEALREQQESALDAGMMADDDLAMMARDSHFDGNVRYSDKRGWFTFRKGAHTWDNDTRGYLVKTEVQTMLRDLRKGENDPRKSMSLGSAGRRDHVVTMLQGLPDVLDKDEWDTDRDVIAAPNGVIDLRTGELRDGQPGDRITKSVSVAYDPDAKCPRWERFVEEIFADHPDIAPYLQRLLGYGLTGHTSEHVFAVLYGQGSNGKSTLLTALNEILGEHAATVPFDMFTTSGKSRGGPDAELLVGSRLALASETNRSAVLDSAAIKNATGGEEITVNPKYRDPYSFKPQALILLATNYKPTVREQDHGTWRRVKLLPFLQKFDKDPKLEQELRSEYAGILAWLVRGAMDWYASGLEEPECVTEAVADYREESDPLSGFFPGVLEPAGGEEMPVGDVWQRYQDWAQDEGVEPFRSSVTLSKALRERDRSLSTRRTKTARMIVGIRLADPGPPITGRGVFTG